MKISELAQKCGYEYCGRDCEIHSIRYAAAADEDSIAIITNRGEVEATRANCIILLPIFVNTKKTMLFASGSIESAVVRVAKVLLENKEIFLQHTCKYSKVENYYSGKNVKIGNGTVISPNVYIDNDVIIGESCYIEPNVHIGSGTVINENVFIGSGSSIGAKSFYHYYDDKLMDFPGLGKTIINRAVSIGNNTTIQRGTFSDTIIGEDCKIGNLIDIGHDVTIGRGCKVVSQVGVASNVTIGNFVQIYGQAGISNNVRVGDFATIFAKSSVTKDVSDGQKVSGLYAREHSEELRIQAKLRRL